MHWEARRSSCEFQCEMVSIIVEGDACLCATQGMTTDKTKHTHIQTHQRHTDRSVIL